MSVQTDVDRGLAIVAELDALKTELKAIEDRLEKAGLNGEQVDLVDAEREGKQFLARGGKQIVPVVFTADLLVKTFVFNSKNHTQIKSVAAGHLGDFYVELHGFKAIYESGKIFRQKAGEILGEQGPAFITACLSKSKNGLPKSDVKIEWKRAENI